LTISLKYDEVIRDNPPAHAVWKSILDKLGTTIQFEDKQLAKWPQDGPLILIANHPFGVVDGIILGDLISRVRLDFKLIVNEVLCREELLNPYLLPIDFRENKEAMQTNIQTRKVALEMLAQGECIGIFPAGAVATAPAFWKDADDLEWKKFVVKLLWQSDATVVPLYFHGQNSRIFQVASHISQDLRLGLLLNEVKNKIGKTLKVTIGDPLSSKQIKDAVSREKILDYLRDKVYQLRDEYQER
jgi:putative hemolysin